MDTSTFRFDKIDTSLHRHPDVAVIVPCYNYGRFLRGCVRSIFNNPRIEVQVLIVDDCSTDETPDVCAELCQEDKRIRAVRHQQNWGHIATYNHGLALVDADYLHLISADDELAPLALERAVAIMRQHSDVGMVYGRAKVFNKLSRPRIAKRPTYSIISGRDWVAARCRDGRNPIYSPEVTLRSVVARASGPYDPRLPLMADLAMWLRAAARSNVAIIKNADQAYYRIHEHNMHRGHANEGLIRALRERAVAYDNFFLEHEGLVPGVEFLKGVARSRLARDALRRTKWAFDQGRACKQDLCSAMEFAKTATADALLLPEWNAIQRRLDKGAPRWRWQQLAVSLFSRAYNWLEWKRNAADLGDNGIQAILSERLVVEVMDSDLAPQTKTCSLRSPRAQ